MLKPSILTVGKFEHYSVSEHGITFKDETPRGEWLDAVKRLTNLYEGSVMTRERTLMLLADTLNWGADKFGEEFAQAIEGTGQALGLTPKTIAKAQWVYKNIPVPLRRDGLTMTHYSVVAALPQGDADKLLSDALARQMTVRDLTDLVAETFPDTKKGKSRKSKPKGNETAATALQKLIDVSDYLSEKGDAVLTDKWKEPISKLYKAFRLLLWSGESSASGRFDKFC